MHILATVVVTLILASLGALHFYWACGGTRGHGAAVPSIGGVAVFVPRRLGTLCVATGLLVAAFLVAASGGIVPAPLPQPVVRAMAGMLAVVLAVRAVGDFRLVGFFKRPNTSAFARLDTLIYAPLCALLSMAIVFVLVNR